MFEKYLKYKQKRVSIYLNYKRSFCLRNYFICNKPLITSSFHSHYEKIIVFRT